MTELLESVDPVFWVFWGVSVVAAVAFGVMLDLGAPLRRVFRRRGRKATVAERIEAAAQAVAASDYARTPAVDPEPTLTIPKGYRNAGSELPTREWVVPVDTSPMPAFQEEPVLPDVAPKPEYLGLLPDGERPDPVVARAAVAAVEVAQLDAEGALDAMRQPVAPLATAEPDVTRDENDTDDQPPSGGKVIATAVMPRYDWSRAGRWPVAQWVPPPGPMLRAGGRRVVGYFKAPIPIQRLYWPARDRVRSARSELDKATADAVALWEQRPWLRAAPNARTRGRHRPDAVDGKAAQRRVTA